MGRFVKGVNSGITKNGDTFTSIEILMLNELSEQEEYRNSHPTKEEVYKEMREENYREETFNDYNGSHAQDYAGYSDQQIDDILSDLQVPIFVSILFFLFQLPIINAYIFKRFSFLSIYNDDGNFNFYGLVFKSWIFGSIYYTITKFTNFLISL